MKSTIISLVAAFAIQQTTGHATFQDLWVNGFLNAGTCIRTPPSNNPVTSVSSTDIRCNVGGTKGVSGKCTVAAGTSVTVEMHQQSGDRSCANEAIGGAHYGPVIVYMSKVSDSSTADGSTGWFKIFEDGWAPANKGAGDNDHWGTNDLNSCCGKMDVKIPADIPAGDYLLRAEVIALHVAGSTGGAQFYMSCYQLTVTGGGSATPATVKFPGAYAASDPGILINIHAAISTYVVPGPAVYSGGTIKSAGSPCSGAAATASAVTTLKTAVTSTKAAAATGTAAAGSSGNSAGCAAARFEQCGGNNFGGCTTCASGTTCVGVSAPYYYQCQ
ncbi:carbohydrate-binding module family 1 protein [Glonium stellatum]|uniref:AA9 family lytic polysaccharide monooxygenase n=1 Tax=Glonium stellatum TaxID=574774 RepID=A0A8E2ESQ3_9PEZI|nr:carbohydrate-binding module family 1 protein [Glonium stellatum]